MESEGIMRQVRKLVKKNYYLCNQCYTITPLEANGSTYYCIHCDTQLSEHHYYTDAKSNMYTAKYGGRVKGYYGRKTRS